MKFYKKASAFTALALASSLAFASPTTSGIYVGANFGGSYVNVLNIFGDGSITAAGGFAANVNAGYQFNRFIALETGGTVYTDIGGPTGNSNLYTVHLAAKLMIPFNERFNIFGKIGGALLIPEDSDDTDGGSNVFGGLFFGAGAAYAITDQLDVEVQTSGVTQGLVTVGIYSAGLTYHFNTL